MLVSPMFIFPACSRAVSRFLGTLEESVVSTPGNFPAETLGRRS